VERYILNHVPLFEIYQVLECDTIPRKKKRDYLYRIKGMKRSVKDNIWTNFIGDKGFNYSYDSPIMLPFQKIRYDFQHHDRYYLGK